MPATRIRAEDQLTFADASVCTESCLGQMLLAFWSESIEREARESTPKGLLQFIIHVGNLDLKAVAFVYSLARL